MKSNKILFVGNMVFLLTLTGCGGGTSNSNYVIPSSDNVLYVNLGSYTPTGNEAGADVNSTTSTQEIADDFEKETGIKIKWTVTTGTGGVATTSQECINRIQTGTMPAIMMTWSLFKDRDYYMPLDEYLKTPNEFLSADDQAAFPTWGDQFYSYLLSTADVDTNDKGETIAMPFTLNPGPATGWFYNKKAFADNSYEVPTSWNQFRTLTRKFRRNPGAGPYPWSTTMTGITDQWDFNFSIGPSFAKYLASDLDADGNGTISLSEKNQAYINGVYSPLQSRNPKNYQIARAAYYTLKDYYNSMLSVEYRSVDGASPWGAGTAVLRENGLWTLPVEEGFNNTREWESGIFPIPSVGLDSKEFLTAYKLTDAASRLTDPKLVQIDPDKKYNNTTRADAFIKLYEPEPSLYVNLMKHGIYDNKKVLENAIKFLKFCTLPENISKMVVEKQGVLQSVYGAAPGSVLNDWISNAFAKEDTNAGWVSYLSSSYAQDIDNLFMSWVGNGIEDEDFFTQFDALQVKDGKAYKGEDTGDSSSSAA